MQVQVFTQKFLWLLWKLFYFVDFLLIFVKEVKGFQGCKWLRKQIWYLQHIVKLVLFLRFMTVIMLRLYIYHSRKKSNEVKIFVQLTRFSHITKRDMHEIFKFPNRIMSGFKFYAEKCFQWSLMGFNSLPVMKLSGGYRRSYSQVYFTGLSFMKNLYLRQERVKIVLCQVLLCFLPKSRRFK